MCSVCFCVQQTPVDSWSWWTSISWDAPCLRTNDRCQVVAVTTAGFPRGAATQRPFEAAAEVVGSSLCSPAHITDGHLKPPPEMGSAPDWSDSLTSPGPWGQIRLLEQRQLN